MFSSNSQTKYSLQNGVPASDSRMFGQAPLCTKRWCPASWSGMLGAIKNRRQTLAHIKWSFYTEAGASHSVEEISTGILLGDIFNSSPQTNLFGDYQHQRLCHLSSIMDSLTEGRGYKHRQLRPESPSLEVDIHPGAPSPSDTMDHIILVPCAGDFCKPSFGNHLGSYYWGGENTKRCKYTCICSIYRYTRTLWHGTSTHSWFLVWYCW